MKKRQCPFAQDNRQLPDQSDSHYLNDLVELAILAHTLRIRLPRRQGSRDFTAVTFPGCNSIALELGRRMSDAQPATLPVPQARLEQAS